MKHIPNRKCICCNEIKNKNELVRIAMVDSTLCVKDQHKKYAGRGAYVCNSEKCFEMLEKKNVLSRAFRTKISANAYETLRKEFFC